MFERKGEFEEPYELVNSWENDYYCFHKGSKVTCVGIVESHIGEGMSVLNLEGCLQEIHTFSP